MLGQRVLNVQLTLSNGSVVTLDETLDLRVQMKAVALGIQAHATIQVYNLSLALRQKILSRISAYQNNLTQTSGSGNPFVPVSITAGYRSPTSTSQSANQDVTQIFTGEAYASRLFSGPPNVGIQIMAATHQVDKTLIPSALPPAQLTFLSAAQYVATQAGLQLRCTASCNAAVITNPFVTATNVGQLPKMLLYLAPTNNPVDVFIESGTLYVRDRSANVSSETPLGVSEFIGVPNWNEYGCDFSVLFRSDLRMHTPVAIQSVLNPSLNGNYVPYQIEHELTSRGEPFYTHVAAAVPANQTVQSGGGAQ